MSKSSLPWHPVRLLRAALAAAALAWVPLAASVPVATVATGCGCDPAAECAAREGVSEASVDGENKVLCGENGSISIVYSGPNVEESGRYAYWAAYDKNDVRQWTCDCDVGAGVVGACAFTGP